MEITIKMPRIAAWPIEGMTGYKPKTTFWEDFSIADVFGGAAVADTFKRAFKEWRNDVVYITELAMVLNWKISQHYERNMALARLYDSLWRKVDEWCCENLHGEDAEYYFQTTD